MRKVALVFVLAVFVPSLILASLALRSLRDQQFILERQQSLLYQGVADSLARDIANRLTEHQREFGQQVEKLLAQNGTNSLASSFDDLLRKEWPLAEVGFIVSMEGKVLCPPLLTGRPAARQFRQQNDRFLCNVESVDVYWNMPKGVGNAPQLDQKNSPQNSSSFIQENNSQMAFSQRLQNNLKRTVVPQSQMFIPGKGTPDEVDTTSKVAPSEAEFRQLIGDANEGLMARFLDNKLNLMTWYRSPRNSHLVFGSKLDLARLTEDLRPLVGQLDPALRTDICAALLDDLTHPLARSDSSFNGNWRHPFVATEVGEVLPHWEIAVYLLHPDQLTSNARLIKWTIAALVLVMLVAIGTGSWLIVTDLNRQLALARQKTDFVSNVSHELKTPLTSIRMFSELLSEGRVTDIERQQSYLQIITAETRRLTRLINNVLDFARLERGDRPYQFQRCDLAAVTRDAVERFRPSLDEAGFRVETKWPAEPAWVNGEPDALAQIILNLVSNAEKYAGEKKEITVEVATCSETGPAVEARVLDRGLGVPKGCEGKIFEHFYRAHDSLSSGIQGSGLGLTLARQMARAHGGDVIYQPRDGGGSYFTLRLPLDTTGA